MGPIRHRRHHQRAACSAPGAGRARIWGWGQGGEGAAARLPLLAAPRARGQRARPRGKAGTARHARAAPPPTTCSRNAEEGVCARQLALPWHGEVRRCATGLSRGAISQPIAGRAACCPAHRGWDRGWEVLGSGTGRRPPAQSPSPAEPALGVAGVVPFPTSASPRPVAALPHFLFPPRHVHTTGFVPSGGFCLPRVPS